jgi:hypothetical protein
MFDREPNIDIVFRNGLKDFEVLPPSDIWEGIPPVAVAHSKKRIMYAAVAAVALLMTLSLAVLALLKNPVNRTDNIASLSDVSAPADAKGTNKISFTIRQSAPIQQTIIREKSAITESSAIITQSNLPLATFPAMVRESLMTEEKGKIPALGDQAKKESLAQWIKTSLSEKPQKVFTVAENEPVRISSSKLIMGGSISPALNMVSSGGDENTASLMDNEKNLPELSAALSVGYKMSKRWSIQTGLGVTSVGRIVSGIDVYTGLSKYYSSKGEFNYAVQTASGVIIANNTDVRISDNYENRVASTISSEAFNASKLPLNYVNSDVKQRFRYLELPVIARYKVIDRRIDINVSGGLSYGYLIENVAFATVSDEKVKVGYTEGINKHSFSSQMGLGMEYNLTKKVSLNIEPVVRYYFTPFSETSNSLTRPYSIGIFSGFFYRF